MKHQFFLPITISALLGTACGNLNTDLHIPETPMPASFEGQQKQEPPSGHDIDWRDYFADSHLLKLIDTAVGNNLDLQIALQRIETTRSSVKLANGAMLPKVDLAIGGGVRKFGLYTMDGAGNATTDITPGNTVPEILPDMFVGLQSSWEIDVWGKLRN
ncbi:MAG: TolC family protein, partial [Methylomonas sp.]|nr:TolC family protein [Methylomonas sp.]